MTPRLLAPAALDEVRATLADLTGGLTFTDAAIAEIVDPTIEAEIGMWGAGDRLIRLRLTAVLSRVARGLPSWASSYQERTDAAGLSVPREQLRAAAVARGWTVQASA